MKVKFNVVTWYSRLLSYVFIFGIFPCVVFIIGVRYNQTVEVLSFSYVSASEAYMNGSYDTKSLQSPGSHAARTAIAGTWVSNEDLAYEMTIKPDTMFYEKRDGSIDRSGSWMIRGNLSGTDYAHLPEGMYLQKNSLSMSGAEETLYYKIQMLNSNTLDMKDLKSEKTYTFSKKAK